MMRKTYLRISASLVFTALITSCASASNLEKGLPSPSQAEPSVIVSDAAPFSTVRAWLGLLSQGDITKSQALEDGSVYRPLMTSTAIASASQVSLTSGTTTLPIPRGYKDISLVITRFFAHYHPGPGPKDEMQTWDVVLGEPLTHVEHWRVLGATHVGQSSTLLQLAGESADDRANITTAPTVTAEMITGARLTLAGFLDAEKVGDLVKARSFLDSRLDLKWNFAATFGAVKDFKLKNLIVERFINGTYWPLGWYSPPYRPGLGYRVSLPVGAYYTLKHPTIFDLISVFTVSLRDDGKWLIVNAGTSP